MEAVGYPTGRKELAIFMVVGFASGVGVGT